MFRINWDAIGVTTSLACAIHCAILPLFLTSLPLFGINIIHNLPFEYGMVIIALAVGTYSLYHGQKKHHHRWFPYKLFFLGIILLLAKITWHQWEIWLLLPAVGCIISAHVLNYRFCRIHKHGHSDDCDH